MHCNGHLMSYVIIYYGRTHPAIFNASTPADLEDPLRKELQSNWWCAGWSRTPGFDLESRSMPFQLSCLYSDFPSPSLTQQGANHPLGGSFGYLASGDHVTSTNWLTSCEPNEKHAPCDLFGNQVEWGIWGHGPVVVVDDSKKDDRMDHHIPSVLTKVLHCMPHHTAHTAHRDVVAQIECEQKTYISHISSASYANGPTGNWKEAQDASGYTMPQYSVPWEDWPSLRPLTCPPSFLPWHHPCHLSSPEATLTKLACIVSPHLWSLSCGLQAKVLVFCHLLDAATPNYQS